MNFKDNMKKIIIILSLIVFFSNLSLVIAQDKANQKSQCIKAMRSITAAECLDHVKYLAGKECEGRGTCDEGFDKAAIYVADHFRDAGLLPLMKNSSFYQEFKLNRNKIGDGNELSLEILVPSPSGKDSLLIPYQIEEDFLPAGVSSPCDIKVNVIFAGYGITSVENDWDDYKKVDVKDKIVMVLGGTPPLEGSNFGSLYRISSKANFAENAGAAALFVVGKPIGTISDYRSVPVIVISEDAANDILKGTGQNIKSLKEKIKDKQKSFSLKIRHKVKLKINSKLLTDCKTMNILAYIEGSDVVLKNEFIVVGAHVDHLGTINDHVFYGANDNASGSAVIMEVAEAFSLMKEAPKRSVLFIAFTGEEMGLLGSSYFVENSIIPVNTIKAMINLDMVGSGDDAIMIVGGNSFPEFAELFDTLTSQYVHVPVKRRWASSNSDHYPFHKAGIPAVFLYAMRGVPTYHTSKDRPETLDPEVMENVGRLVFMTAVNLANKESISFRYIEK